MRRPEICRHAHRAVHRGGRGAPWSPALTGTTQNDGLQISITGAVLARVRGKTVSFAVLCHIPHEAGQDIQVKFTTNSSDQVTGSIQNALDKWKWIVMAGPLRSAPTHRSEVPLFHPSSFDLDPFCDVPFHIQKLIIVEGDAPQGGM